MKNPLRRLSGVALLAVLVGASPPVRIGAPVELLPAWSATWSAPQATSQAEGFGSETLRMVVNSSLGGDLVRVRLSNIFSTGTAVFGHVTIGVQESGATTQGTPVTVTFGGSQSVSLGPGAFVVSDPTPFVVPAHTRLLVSLFLPPQHSGTAPLHPLADDTEYNYWGSADISASPVFTVSNTYTYTMYVEDVDVSTAAASTVVAVGDSITDGANLAPDSDTRWPDYLAARIAPAGLAVANAGVNGDTVTGSSPGIAARWSRDVLGVPGVRTVIDEGGINDLRLGVTATALEAAQTSLITQAHTAGLKILLTTITPCSGASSCTTGFETQRQAYNAWVRAGGVADGFVDFDHAIGNAAALATAYDSGDHLHPNAAGQDMLANAVDPSLL